MAAADRTTRGAAGVGVAARETAGITTRLILQHVRARGGEGAVDDVLLRAGIGHGVAALEDEAGWTTYAEKIALFEAAAAVLDDPLAARHIGETVLEHSVGLPLKLLLRALGSPGQVLRNIARTAPRFSTVCTMSAPEVRGNAAVVTYLLHHGHTPSRFDCDYNRGLLSQVPVLFGLAPAEIEHDACQVQGAAQCEYRLRWARRRHRPEWRRNSRVSALEEQLAEVTERGRSLQSTIADLVSTDDVDSVLARITVRAGEAVRAPRYLLVVRSVDAQPMRVHAHGFGGDPPAALVEELLADQPDDGDGTRLVVDVASARRHYGRLAALSDSGDTFFPEEGTLLATYARHAAAALDAATALAEAREREQTGAVMLDLARSLARLGTTRAMAGRLADAVPRVVPGLQRVVVGVWDAEEDTLAMTAAQGWSAEHSEAVLRLRIRPSDTPELGAMLSSPKARTYSRDTEDPLVRGLMQAFDTSVFLVVPIVARGEFLGLVCADTGENGEPLQTTPEMWRRLSGLADQAAVALENARLLERLRASEERALHQAHHDPLTGLPNRLRYMQRLQDALENAGPDGILGVMLLDLDNFKVVNDTMGHAAADRLLQEVAARIAGCVRAQDTAARLGGDEFALVLRNLSHAEDAVGVAEKIQDELRRPVVVDGAQLQVTASVGIALHPHDGGDGDTLLGNADTAMYRAKRAGRDAWRMFGERRRAMMRRA